MSANESLKKKPPSTKRTGSLNSTISKPKYSARDKQWREDKIKSLHDRLTNSDFHVRMPGTLFTAQWRELIGSSGYQLLGVLMRTCDWKEKRWHGNIFVLAAVMGLSEKAVRNQLNRLKRIDGFEVKRHPWSITIYLPERIFPSVKEKNYGKSIK